MHTGRGGTRQLGLDATRNVKIACLGLLEVEMLGWPDSLLRPPNVTESHSCT